MESEKDIYLRSDGLGIGPSFRLFAARVSTSESVYLQAHMQRQILTSIIRHGIMRGAQFV